MSSLFPDFEQLHKDRRVKFIDVAGQFFAFNVKESYLVQVNSLEKFSDKIVITPIPPVKTLILHTTYECNLRCKHCYLNAGQKRTDEMSSQELSRVVREFGEMGGLSVDLSGGEALLKDGIEDVIKTAREQRLRTVVLSNAIDLDRDQLESFAPHVDGIAIGIDGLYDSNDEIRGQGSFSKIVKGLEIIVNKGVELSVTTLITPESLPQLVQFPRFIAKYGGRSWSLVMPRPSGRFGSEQEKINETCQLWETAKRKGLLKELQRQAKESNVTVVLDHILVPGAKRRVEETSKDFVYEVYNKGRACWDNTLTIMPNGDVKCCLFFDGQVYDNVRGKSLREVYESRKRANALAEFRKYPVDKCPFIEKGNRLNFEEVLR